MNLADIELPLEDIQSTHDHDSLMPNFTRCGHGHQRIFAIPSHFHCEHYTKNVFNAGASSRREYCWPEKSPSAVTNKIPLSAYLVSYGPTIQYSDGWIITKWSTKTMDDTNRRFRDDLTRSPNSRVYLGGFLNLRNTQLFWCKISCFGGYKHFRNKHVTICQTIIMNFNIA